MIAFTTEFITNIEYMANPSHVRIYLSDDQADKIKLLAGWVKTLGLFSGDMINWVAYDLLTEGFDEDGLPELSPFEYVYRVDTTVLRIYGDGEFSVEFTLKNSGDGGTAGPMRLEEGVHS